MSRGAMKVAVYIPVDLNGNGGVEKHVLRLAEALRQLGLEIDVFGKNPRNRQPTKSHPTQLRFAAQR